MMFLITQMLVCIVLALVTGGALGWIAHRTQSANREAELRQTIGRQHAQVQQAKTDVAMVTQDFDDLKARSQSEIDVLKQENKRLPSLHSNLEKSQLLVRQMMQKHEAQLRELTVANEELTVELGVLRDREAMHQRTRAELELARTRSSATAESPSDEEAVTSAALPSGDDDRQPASTPSDPALTDSTPESAKTDDAIVSGVAASETSGVDAMPADLRPAASPSSSRSSWASAPVPDVVATAPTAADTSDASDTVPMSAVAEPVPPQTDQAEPASETPDEDLSDDAELIDTPADIDRLFDTVDQHDDLKCIFGIGPVTEKALNQLGITSYSQLAELKRHDIETIADALQIFPSRIERDDWVGNARRQLEDVLEEL